MDSSEETPSCADAVIPDQTRLCFPPSGEARLPFRRGVNHVLVDLEDVSGRRCTFFVDTGASFSVVTPTFLALAEAPRREDVRPDRAFGAHGELTSQASVREIPVLRAGDLVLQNIGCVELDLGAVEDALEEPVHGVLGFNVLSRLLTVVDYPRNEIAFLDQARADARVSYGEPACRLPFRLRLGAMIEIDGKINDQTLPFIVDIGAAATFLNGPAAALAGDTQSVTFGTFQCHGVMHPADFPVFDTVGLGDVPAGLLGNDFLGQQRIAVDYVGCEILLWAPEEPET